MQVSRAAAIWLEYHRSHSRENTLKSYQAAIAAFLAEFAGRQIAEISTVDVLSFRDRVTEGKKPQPRRVRYAHLSAFFNFIRNNIDLEFRNPYDTPVMKRLFRNKAPTRRNTIYKDIVDEIIFKTIKPRNRLILEFMARGGMRVGEVLKLTPISGRSPTQKRSDGSATYTRESGEGEAPESLTRFPVLEKGYSGSE